ncbi:NUDIX hydrolase [Streptomyces millisiae]|uniref:NUDIX domain-containing protein n=1 Tax=Streptomyces millisiae TaxID=3075542 RepID=A0ABU2LT93_9ACTN|nr:NUDIX domain-containing protein [Streptomyces sp. DSM 44918]MDT0320812.1 NUDIX domain-containing protein [Streptomyces sp. DSM 44918]
MTQRAYVDALIIFERAGQVLLAERANTGYADGRLNLPSGKVEHGESVVRAAVREAREEVGVDVDPAALRIVHTMHYRSPEGSARVGFFFATNRWAGALHNAEPHKCAGLFWHDPRRLPGTVVRYNALGIGHYLRGEPASVHGW